MTKNSKKALLMQAYSTPYRMHTCTNIHPAFLHKRYPNIFFQ